MTALTRRDLESMPRRRLHDGRNLTKAVVDLVEIGGRAVVLKDLSSRPWLVRVIVGPWQLDREERAYRALAGARGTPAFLARVDRQAIALEYVAGRSLASFRPGDLDSVFFDRLDSLVRALHARGVAHGDLHRHDVLAGPGNEPYLVDFSTSVALRPGAGWVSRFLFRQMCRADLRSAAKLRRRLLPAQGGEVPDRPGLYRIGRRVKAMLDVIRRRE
jgi:RIO1 family protein